jgi:hypothetical protein
VRGTPRGDCSIQIDIFFARRRMDLRVKAPPMTLTNSMNSENDGPRVKADGCADHDNSQKIKAPPRFSCLRAKSRSP